ncbi:hypothetical protein EG68_06731 [Paragonimus skrjabini miyazakii]|uniref:DUF7041 domain-containing protein n=1 Tax=Paragonimus skrjabini miyazakii TaxID=59628 RepID=A0A8S9YRY6_9TREM|nr:hypothetical protein EG68_06731 [Paragonimus skrjabini miyazakii]
MYTWILCSVYIHYKIVARLDDTMDIDIKAEHNVVLKLPGDSARNPRLRFHQIEAVFITRCITSEKLKFSYVVHSLPVDLAVEVEDLLEPVPSDSPHTIPKDAIIKRTGRSGAKLLHDLFNSVDLGDRSPSQLLRYMRGLLGLRELDDAILK